MRSSEKDPRVQFLSKTLNYTKITILTDDVVDLEFNNVPAGVFDFSITLLNKSGEDTIIDENGEQQDLGLVIEGVWIDNVEVTGELNMFSSTTNWDGEKIRTFGWITFPNPYCLTLQAPGWRFKRNLVRVNFDDRFDELIYKTETFNS